MNQVIIAPNPAIKPQLIGIHGHANSGKDTVALYLSTRYEDHWVLAFADVLKDVCSMMFGLTVPHFHERDLKEVIHPVWKISPRMMAQFVGTELVRNNMWKLLGVADHSFWVSRLEMELTDGVLGAHYDAADTVIIPDVRFQDEYDWIIANGGHVIHLTRPGATGNIGLPSHESEKSINLHTKERTHEIANIGSLQDLYLHVDEFIGSINP